MEKLYLLLDRFPQAALRTGVALVTLFAIALCSRLGSHIDNIANENRLNSLKGEARQYGDAFRLWLHGMEQRSLTLQQLCRSDTETQNCITARYSVQLLAPYARVSISKGVISADPGTYPQGVLAGTEALPEQLQAALRSVATGTSPQWLLDDRDPQGIYHAIALSPERLLLSRIERKQLNTLLAPGLSGALRPVLALTVTGVGSPRYLAGDPDSTLLLPLQEWHSNGKWQLGWTTPLQLQPGPLHELANLITGVGILISILTGAIGWIALNGLYASRRHARDLESLTEELADSERNYRMLVEQIPGIVFRSKPGENGHQLLLASPSISLMTGYAEREFLPSGSRQYMELVHPQDQAKLAEQVRAHSQSEGTYEIEYRLRSGRGQWLWVLECAQSREHPSGAILIDGIVFDITARKQAQYTLQQSDTMLHAIIDQPAHIAIQGYTSDGHVVFWNRASELLYGWSSAEAVGKRVDQLLFNSRELLSFLTQLSDVARTHQAAEPFEAPLQTKSGQRRWALCTIFLVDDYLGEQVFVCMDVDIHARKEAEQELQAMQQRLQSEVHQSQRELQTANSELEQALKSLVHAETLATLGSLVAGLAHELNTPLGNTLTVATTLRDSARDIGQHNENGTLKKSSVLEFLALSDEAAELIERNARRASELIAHFKTVATDTSSERRREFDLGQTIREVLTTLTPQLKHQPHRITVAADDGLLLDSYPGALEQILTNLIINSIKHAFAEGLAGQITISACRSADELIQLQYRDDGCGIPPEQQEDVFTPFFTTKLAEGGSGLGLYIVKNLTETVLGGSLRLESTPGQGTAFTLDLPRVAPAETRKENNNG
ncbi:PAS domain-containing sensor histidine kinase [Chitinilyticum piscinae]|uniref:histidine kinase n=1 Tax=Chitinilyticum piscinae TaxID=2866724 RepID=A0A8J7KAZ7_9NEIS|nr:PAS domain-containing sensor histidine kinase [Chitinilyticum piscinae]MBE9609664.1 PAS domain-containing sensor histidine kinase [Chitinilyticum piscinae]